jgi:hypothetical protein
MGTRASSDRWNEDRGNTPMHLLKDKEPLLELPMQRNEVDQHWLELGTTLV